MRVEMDTAVLKTQKIAKLAQLCNTEGRPVRLYFLMGMAAVTSVLCRWAVNTPSGKDVHVE